MTVKKEAKKKVLDSSEVVTRTTPVFTATSEILSILIFLFGCVVLLGWALDIPVLKSVLPSFVTMKVNTALGFIFSGLSIWLLQIKHWENPHFKRMALLSSSIVFGIGLATVLEYALGWDLEIDQLLFKELPGAMLTSSPGRMAFSSAINFTMIGLALFWVALKTKKGRLFAQLLLLPTAGITLLSLIGYIYKAPPLVFGLHFSTAMALHTVVLFLLVFLATLFCHPGCGLMVVASSDSNGGKVIRRLFPVTILLPVILGWLKLRAEKMEIVSDELGGSLVAAVNLTFITLYVFALSFWLDKSDAESEGVSKKLRESEKFLTAMINSISDVFYVFDEEGKFILWNKAFEKATGYSCEEVSRMRVRDLFDQEGAVNIAEAVKIAFEKGFISVEESFLTKDGRKIPMLFSGSMAKDLSGRPILCGTGKDITRRVQAQVALKLSEEKLRTIYENTTDGIIVTELEDKKFSDANKSMCQMLGYSLEEVKMLGVADIHPKEALTYVLEQIETQSKDVKLPATDLPMKRKDGSIFYANVLGTRMNIMGKNHMVAIVRDTTERHRMVEELKRAKSDLESRVKERTTELERANQKLREAGKALQRASKAKSEFLANMSHELRTPLTSIIGFSEVLYDERLGVLNKPQKECTQNVLTSGRHLLSLINDVLDLSKVESGKMVLEVSLFSIKDCLEEVLRVTAGVAFSKKINPVVEIAEDLGEINADLRKIKQIIFNLMSNAIKFTPDGGEVGLRARRDGSGIEVVVWDMGIGIPPKDLGKVFEAFERLGDPYTQETEGTGLGLTITQKLVELHGGKIWIESGGIGKGTAVKFMIPTSGV